MNRILEAYNTAVNTSQLPPARDHTEFELRFSIGSPDEYKALLMAIVGSARSSNASISRTINIIKEVTPKTAVAHTGRTNMIASMTYSERNGAIVKDGALTYSSKRLIDSFAISSEFAPCKIVVSAEAPADKFATEPFSRLRIKLRISVTLDAFPGWRFDFTLANELTSSADLAKKRDILFRPGLSIESFAANAPFEHADALEFEVEFVGSVETAPTTPTESGIYAIIDHLREAGGFHYTMTAEYQATVFEIAKLLYPPGKAENFRSRQGLKHLIAPPISLDRTTYFTTVLPNITTYNVTIKADGVGTIGLIIGNSLRVVGGELTRHELAGDRGPAPTVYLAELIGDAHYVFDVYMYKGENLLSSAEINTRIKYIPDVVAMIGAIARQKEYIALTTDYANELKRLWERKYEFPVDGIIFGDRYKWKPVDKLTIDFLTMRAPASVLGRPPHIAKPGHELYFLFCGINRNQATKYRIHNVAGYSDIFKGRTFYDYYPIQFAPPSAPNAYIYQRPDAAGDLAGADIHNRICEYKWHDGTWHLERIRTDRDVEVARGSYFGNGIAVANSNWDIIQDPLTFDMLRSAPEDVAGSYFGATDTRYKAANMFSSFAKNKSLAAYKNLSWVVDLAAGRGADLGRWGRNGIKHALCIDNDADALKELQRRHESNQRETRHSKLAVYTHRANLLDEAKSLVKTIHATFPLPKDGAPLVVCNMAIHYFCENDATIGNFILLVEHMTALNGHFIFTCYNGARVFELIGAGERIDYYDESVLKYSIERGYPEGAPFHNFGQVIRPLLACAGGVHRDEYLVNIAYIIRLFKQRGFKLVEQVRFDSLLEEYSIDNLDAYDKLSDADFNHVGLYDYVILQKVKEMSPAKIAKAEQKTDVSTSGNSIVVAMTPEVQKMYTELEGLAAASPPIMELPTKSIQAHIALDDATVEAIHAAQISLIVRIDGKKYKGAAPGWRIELANESKTRTFEVIVDEIHKFTGWTDLFGKFSLSAMAAADIDKSAFQAGIIAAAGIKKLGKTGLIVFKVRAL